MKFLLIFFFLVLAACDSFESKQVYPNLEYFRADSFKQAKELQDHLVIECEDPYTCPESVGSLAFLSQDELGVWGIGYCSQTLLPGRQRILTNRHCLPEKSQLSGADCSDIMLYYPQTLNKAAEKVRCKTVVSLADKPSLQLKDSSLDWAILELERRLERKPIEYNVKGIANKTNLTLYPTYFHKEKNLVRSGKIKKVNCQSEMGSWFSVFYKHPKSFFTHFVCDDKIIGGTSGTGMQNSAGELVGVVQMGICVKGGCPDTKESVFTTMYGKKQELTKQTVGGGTNLACVPALNPEPAPECSYPNKESFAGMTDLGLYLSLFYALQPTNIFNQHISLSISNTPEVEWTSYNLDFHKQILKINDQPIAEAFSPEVSDQIFYFYGQSLMPQVPRCIHSTPQTTNTTYHLRIPVGSFWQADVKVGEEGKFSLPLNEVSFLSFAMIYEADSHSFKGSFERLPLPSRQDFLSDMHSMRDVHAGCLLKQDPGECQKYFYFQDKLKTQIEHSLLERSLFSNERFLAIQRVKNIKIQIPTCL